MPVVPRIERPPTMPSRPLSVRRAIASPPGIEIVDLGVGARRRRRGHLLDGGTDHGARRRIDRRLADCQRQAGPRHRADARRRRERHAGARAAPRRTCALTSAPWVTSGSSPASLTMPAVAVPSQVSCSASAKAGCWPFGSVIVDRIGKLAREKRGEGGLRRRGGAGAGRPAVAQRAGRLVAVVDPVIHAREL